MRDLALPPAPPLTVAPVGEPTPQRDERDELGSPIDKVLSTCRYCWGHHPGACPFIQEVRWHPTGQIARVVLKERADHEKLIVYPGEEDGEILKHSLKAITEAESLEVARKLATALLDALKPEA